MSLKNSNTPDELIQIEIKELEIIRNLLNGIQQFDLEKFQKLEWDKYGRYFTFYLDIGQVNEEIDVENSVNPTDERIKVCTILRKKELAIVQEQEAFCSNCLFSPGFGMNGYCNQNYNEIYFNPKRSDND